MLGLIGAKIQGSLSPALFTDAFAAAGMDGYYHLIDVDRLPCPDLPRLLEAIKAVGFTGANITHPFKQKMLPLLDTVDPEAAQVGAVNTVAIATDGRTTGYNFDRRGRSGTRCVRSREFQRWRADAAASVRRLARTQPERRGGRADTRSG